MTGEQLVQWLLVLFGGAMGAEAVRAVLNRRKMRADVAGTLTNATLALLTPVTERLQATELEAAKLRREVVTLQDELHDARRECGDLRDELHDARAELAQLRGSPGPPDLPPRKP